MPGKKIDLKAISPLFIVFIVAVLLVSSTLVIMIGGSNVDNSATKNNAVNGSSELYVAVAPDMYPGLLSMKEIGNGQNITYNTPGTSFNFSINQTINMTASVINHQGRAMNYSIIVYQMVNDTANNMTNFTSLYVGRLDPMIDHSIGWCHVQTQVPLASGNNTVIGVLLMDSNDNTTVLNEMDFTANVFLHAEY